MQEGCVHCGVKGGYDRTYQRCTRCGEPYHAGSMGLHFRTKEPPPAEYFERMERNKRYYALGLDKRPGMTRDEVERMLGQLGQLGQCPADPPMPSGFVMLHDSEVTPSMKAWADSLAYASTPYNLIDYETFGGKTYAARVEHHAYRQNADGTRTPGCYHGVTLYHAPETITYPSPTASPAKLTELVLLASAVFASSFAAAGAYFRRKRGIIDPHA